MGGLSNQLAAHMEIDNPQHRDLVGRFWDTDSVAAQPGLKAVELFHAVERGEVKALWVMATNPAVSLPDTDQYGAPWPGANAWWCRCVAGTDSRRQMPRSCCRRWRGVRRTVL